MKKKLPKPKRKHDDQPPAARSGRKNEGEDPQMVGRTEATMTGAAASIGERAVIWCWAVEVGLDRLSDEDFNTALNKMRFDVNFPKSVHLAARIDALVAEHVKEKDTEIKRLREALQTCDSWLRLAAHRGVGGFGGPTEQDLLLASAEAEKALGAP